MCVRAQRSIWGKSYVLLLSNMYLMRSCLLCFQYFFFILGLLDSKCLANCYHMSSLCTAVIDLM